MNAARAQAILMSLLCMACSKPGEDSEAKRSPIPEPAPGVKLPSDISIPVELGSKVVLTITSKMLDSRVPDFKDDERQAWRLDKLLDEKVFPRGSVLEASGSDGVGISMHRPSSEEEPLPVVVLTRRGEVVAAIVKANDPFPDYHGQGGRLHRPGDPLPRLLTSLVRLRVSPSTTHSDPEPPTIKTLELKVGESPPVRLTAELLANLPSSTVIGDSGGEQTRWNLRDLVNAGAGEGATLVKVVGATELAVSAEEWKNESMRPVLQENRRGELKFQWLDKESVAKPAGSVRSVRLLQIQR